MARVSPQTATRAGARLWAPFPVRPFLSTYSTEQLARFVRTHVDDPFASKFARFVEIVGMNGAAFVGLEDDALERLCRNELPGLYELQNWKTCFKKPTTPHIRDVFGLPPISPLLPESSCPSSPRSQLRVCSASVSDADTPEWAPDEDSLLSTPESSRFSFDDPSHWTPDVEGEQVEIAEAYYSYGESPYATYRPIAENMVPSYHTKNASSALDTDNSTPRLSRRSSAVSLRSIRILNFDEADPEQFSPTMLHQDLEQDFEIRTSSHICDKSPPVHRPPDPRYTDSPPLAPRLNVESWDASPDSNPYAPATQSAELSLLQLFFFCDLDPSDSRGASLEKEDSRSSLQDGYLPTSLLLGHIYGDLDENPSSETTSMFPSQNNKSLSPPPITSDSDPSNNATSDDSSFFEDPWNLDLSDDDSGVGEDAPAASSRTIVTFPAIVVGEAPLSQGMVIVEVDEELQRLLNDSRHPVDAFVDAEDRLVITSTAKDLSSPLFTSYSGSHPAHEDDQWSECVSSDLEDDAFASPVASHLSVTPLIEASALERDLTMGLCSLEADLHLVPTLSTMEGLRNFHATSAFDDLCDDRRPEQKLSPGLHSSLISSPATSDHLPFPSCDLSCPPMPPPPTALSPFPQQQYLSSPSVFARRLSEVLIRNQVITGGCLGLTITPDLTVIQTPISPIFITPPFAHFQTTLDDGEHSDAFKRVVPFANAPASKPKLEIDINYDSLWHDSQLSSLISSVGCGAHHHRHLYPTPISTRRTLSHSPSFSDISSSDLASRSSVSSKDAATMPGQVGRQEVESIQQILPFEGHDINLEGSNIFPSPSAHEQHYQSYGRCPSEPLSDVVSDSEQAASSNDSMPATPSPILTRAIGLLKSLMTPGDPTVEESRLPMRIPGTYDSNLGS
ncbi:hypothetical protein BKA70DRAFT_1222169 [Coprinopsis sp. MPI-PUGE-AT-0042]|nr:hypothetical protein BKA70DRAFT_1222169 [Coprinopsis sp. MPI-PUGE-AT-0042]